MSFYLEDKGIEAMVEKNIMFCILPRFILNSPFNKLSILSHLYSFFARTSSNLFFSILRSLFNFYKQ
jgi:hypothetical protein